MKQTDTVCGLTLSRNFVATNTDLANNKLKEIKSLRNLKQLKKLDLGANRIRVMAEEELSGLENLEELWIGKNKIEKIEGLEKVCQPTPAERGIFQNQAWNHIFSTFTSAGIYNSHHVSCLTFSNR